jgi:hypothetical protein
MVPGDALDRRRLAQGDPLTTHLVAKVNQLAA